MVGLLGRGGSAVVELAVDGSGRRVATKRVALTGSGEDIHAARVRLRREAEILSSLAHPGILPVLDIVDDGADVVLVLPAMAENLEGRVRRLGPLSAGELEHLGRTLIEALAAAHRRGVVHRDIKPANVLFDGEGRPALADFGAALTAEMTGGLTRAGTVLGTPMWMAPEQARGGPVGPPSDIFSLGATLLFAATGAGPYPPGPPLVVLGHAARAELLLLPSQMPPWLGPSLAAMLDPDPACRPSAARLLGGRDDTVTAPPQAGAAPRPGRAATTAVAGAGPRVRSLATGLAARLVGDPPPARATRRRWPAVAAGSAAAVLIAATVALLTTGSHPGRAAQAGVPSRTRPPQTACTPQPYQPCGSPAPAPHTDGVTCDPGWYDLDGSAADGCESHSDYLPGAVLTAGSPLHANLVPPYTTDSFVTHVAGHAMNLCWGTLHVTLTAPAGTAERLSVLKGGRPLASALSAGGSPATASVGKPSCFGSDSEDLTVTVTEVAASGAAGARDFTLARDGGW